MIARPASCRRGVFPAYNPAAVAAQNVTPAAR